MTDGADNATAFAERKNRQIVKKEEAASAKGEPSWTTAGLPRNVAKGFITIGFVATSSPLQRWRVNLHDGNERKDMHGAGEGAVPRKDIHATVLENTYILNHIQG